MKHKFFFLLLFIAAITGCRSDNATRVYHRFPDRTWYRFNILQFEVPVKGNGEPVNVVFFASLGRDYPFDSLAFNMVMKTPSGEERIKECSIHVKDRSGKFLGTFTGDSCEMSLMLKKDLVPANDGILSVELENLVPRMRTVGLNGVGIRLEKP
jgi:gliding motility-associated lipoprotein GldH